jgi:mitogen-activated protein kinase kinase 1
VVATIRPLALGDLRIGAELGRGSAGVVRKAVHERTGTVMALKVVTLTLDGVDEIQRKQMVLELQTLHKISSPHVVQLYDAFLVEGAIYIALEFMDAGTLRDLLHRGGPIGEPVLGKISEQVLSGLAYIHHAHLIHRDIKVIVLCCVCCTTRSSPALFFLHSHTAHTHTPSQPSNLLVNTAGQVKLADFGVSSQNQHTVSARQTVIGTVSYMSPERICAEPHKIDSDVWSFGLVVLECAIGRYPYAVPTVTEATRQARPTTPSASAFASVSLDGVPMVLLMDRIVKGAVPEAPPSASALFRAFVAGCLKKNPTERPSATTLLGHDWIKSCNFHGASVSAWVCSVLKQEFVF